MNQIDDMLLDLKSIDLNKFQSRRSDSNYPLQVQVASCVFEGSKCMFFR